MGLLSLISLLRAFPQFVSREFACKSRIKVCKSVEFKPNTLTIIEGSKLYLTTRRKAVFLIITAFISNHTFRRSEHWGGGI